MTVALTNLPKKIGHAAAIELQALRIVLRHGMPSKLLQFGGGIGDELLLTVVAHELRKRQPGIKIWQVSHSADLLAYNPDYAHVFTMANWQLRYAKILELVRCRLAYAQEVVPREREIPPSIHILAELCRKAGISGQVSIRPYFYFSPSEESIGRMAKQQIVIQNCDSGSYATVMHNKLWVNGRFQLLVDELKKKYSTQFEFIQIGGKEDTLLHGVTDLRGKTSIRQSAAILKNSDCFIGTAGFLMHLARAVECRSVIIYGGREHSSQTGYLCNENINRYLDCAPCWKWSDCDSDRECMKSISVSDVCRAVDVAISKSDSTLETEIVTI